MNSTCNLEIKETDLWGFPILDGMALGKKNFDALKSKSKDPDVENGDLGFGSELIQYERGLIRKRVLISDDEEEESMIESKRICNDNGTCRIESLPQDILVKILCGIEHEDLKQMFHLSKTIREAALIAKESHFVYKTPKKTLVFHGIGFNSDESNDLGDEIEAPGAPLRLNGYRRSRINGTIISGISMCLFN